MIAIKFMRAVSLLSIIALFAIAIFGQSNTGSITGVVRDPNGALVPNATVTVTNQGTNEKRTVQTDADGRYDVPSLSTGIYTIEVTASGFQTRTTKDLRLAVGERARIDLAMSLAGVDTVVTVEGETRVDTETASIGDTISTARIADNPVNGRDFTQLLATIPGSVQSSHQFNASINGIPSTFGGSSVLVDGMDAGRVDLNGTSNVLGRIESRVNRVSMDSIQEIQVVEHNYSAQYGMALGAVINPITKSGTNNFHGSVFEFYRNEALDANDFFNNANGFPKSEFNLNQFGGNFSGPIKRDKVFFFANYEGVRQTRGVLLTAATPTQAFRNFAVPAVLPLIATLPLPTSPLINSSTGLPDPWKGIYREQKDGKLREDTGSVKIDFLQSDKSSFSARYNINDSDTDTPYGVGTDQTAEGTLRVQLFKFSHNYVFSPTVVNEAGFGINHNKTHAGAGPSTLPIVSFLFGDQGVANPGPAQFNQLRTGVVYQFLDTLSMVKNSHSLKFGIDIRLNRRSSLSVTQDTLQFLDLVDPSTLDLAHNLPFIISRSGNPELHYANENFGFFAQDDWKVSPRLSLNLGLRYDVSTVSRERDGLLQNFDPETLTFSAVGEKVHNVDGNNFGPRLGFAWDIRGNAKTVLRGGYGIFYNRELPASWGSPHVNTFPTQSVDFFRYLDCAFGPPFTTAGFGFPIDSRLFTDCALPSAFAIDRNLKTGKAQHWSLNIQQDLGFGTLQVGYVGNHVSDILTDGVVTPININRARPENHPLSPLFGDVFLVGNYPSSDYHALQVNFKRNLSRNLRFNANYTWAHATDDIVGFFRDYQDPNHPELEHASSDQDIRHNFTLDAGYDIPFGEWFDGGPNWLKNGWNISTIIQARTGFPVNVTLSGGVFGGFSGRPNVVPGVDPYDSHEVLPNGTVCNGYSVPDCQFNRDAFSGLAPGQLYGNAGRNLLRGPGFTQFDISVFKTTRFSDTKSLQLRIDFFNIFNKANFSEPSGGLSQGDQNSVRPTAFFGQSLSTVGNNLGGLLGFGGPRQIQLSARFNF